MKGAPGLTSHSMSQHYIRIMVPSLHLPPLLDETNKLAPGQSSISSHSKRIHQQITALYTMYDQNVLLDCCTCSPLQQPLMQLSHQLHKPAMVLSLNVVSQLSETSLAKSAGDWQVLQLAHLLPSFLSVISFCLLILSACASFLAISYQQRPCYYQ